MGKTVAILAVCSLLFSCITHQSDESEEFAFYDSIPSVEVKYAQGFEFEELENGFKITTHSHSGNSQWKDELYGPYTKEHGFPNNAKLISPLINSVCVQSSTYLSFLKYLGALIKVRGVCGLSYVSNEAIQTVLKENNAKEICLGESTQIEKLLSLDPEMYFVYPFASEEVEKLSAKGIKTFMIAEYLETHPLARLEWIKVFGLIFNEFEAANQYFKTKEKAYLDAIVAEPKKENTFFMNVPFGDAWHSPSANSLIVKLCEHAGLSYYFKGESGTENITRSNEGMWEIGAEADYWIIIADRPAGFKMEDLLAEEKVYSAFKSVKKQQVIFCNTRTTDYFTTGIIEPDVLLKELIQAIDGKSSESSKYFQILK